MEGNKQISIKLISLLTLLVVITGAFVIAFTFAGSPEAPDAIATYKKGEITWSGVTVTDGVANLNLFGEPNEGEQYPLISPTSDDKYYLRLQNDIPGVIRYSIYLYTEKENIVPLKFDVTMTDDMAEASSIPTKLQDKKIVSSFTGDVRAKDIKNFEIHWYWDSESDEADMAFGNSAVEILYPISVLIVVDDNYSTGGGYTPKPKDDEEQILDPTITGTLEGVYDRDAYIYGYPDGTFRPENNMTRAEVATIFARILAGFNDEAIKGTSREFNDILKTDWFTRYIAELEDESIIEGYSDGTFRPNNNITRAEFATMTVRFLESKIGEIEGIDSGFTDMSDSHWANEYIEKAVAKGLVKGYPDGTFRPESFITRSEVVTVINRLLVRLPDKALIDENIKNIIRFVDVTDVEYWAYYEIYEAANDVHILLDNKKR